MLNWKKYIVYMSKNYFSTILSGGVNRSCDKFLKGKQKCEELLLKISAVRLKFEEGGGERVKIRHAYQKKTLVDDKMKLLFDNGKYSEMNFFVGYGQSYGDIPRAGSVNAIGKINDRLCTVVANDSTVKGGTIYPIQLKKQLRIINQTTKLRLPFIYVIDSGGAYLQLQSQIFPDKHHGGRVFYSQAVLQSLGIPLISIVCGSCTAGAAYIPNMCSEMGMVDKSSFIFLGGPALVKAATGEIIDSEELGGAQMHASVSGCSDHTFLTETDGLSEVRQMVSTLPCQTVNRTNTINPVDPLFPVDDLTGLLINCGLNYDERRATIIQILARLLDASTLQEFKPQFGSSLITGFGRISGCMVGILAGFDSLTEQDCLKGSHFLQVCSHRKIPIISLVHTLKESDVCPKTPESFGGLLKAKSSLMRSIATRNCSMITVVIGDAVGIDYICLGSQVMEPDFILAWPNADFRCTLSDQEDTVMTESNVSMSDLKEEDTSVLKAAGDMIIDDIIYPSETRKVITDYLEILQTDSNLFPKVSADPVYRF